VVTATTITDREIWTALEEVVDPEIPVLTIADMGILRDVEITDGGSVVVTITPTYSGCPAMDLIRTEILAALGKAGVDDGEVRTVFSPAWTTDWMNDAAKSKLAEFGIAPPSDVSLPAAVLCPRCSSSTIRTVAEFGSTACKALMVCDRCGEPFDHFKEI
jgi:ring-1,2-phenylacetyl-CoA epoxidase subunit PaaD